MRLSVMYPVQATGGAAVAPFAELVHRGSAARLWMGTSLHCDTQQVAAYLAGAGLRIPVGTAVQLTPMRHTFQAAVEARSLAVLTGHPVVAGFGAGAPALSAGLLGAPYKRPASAVAAYLSAVRGHLERPEEGLPPIDHPQVELGAGVLRPGMARAAGRTADAAITLLTPPHYLKDTVVPALAEGAAGADREPPRVVAVVHAAVERPGREPARLAYAACGAHLTLPHYTDMLRRAGVAAVPQDPVAGAMRVSEAGLFLYGGPERIAAELEAYAGAGVDEVIVSTAGVMGTEGPEAAVADAAAVLAAAA
ncbi:LLM class flavin-dependent oxidoreductase [Streptomonospora sp. PA3]|uniref:LLM class flavin-dependent oxidoreductase n=1 Tax=Streptomonospora sp. PA3 TaxID=2607326 RepID=UPI0012DE3EEF|nr:LLM class flavin-dependent oxidoreductase [Streptomonospora sp. PA3]MUL42616.1 LLM class flavin-dependent oxidoreductase [Streptomonospora sp. PA3]